MNEIIDAGCGCEDLRATTALNRRDAHDASRRQFLKTAASGAAALAAAAALPRVVLGAPGRTGRGAGRDVLVVVFLRGGMDGLTTCVPYGDAELYNRRPTLAITPPGTANGATDLDGFFGLAPASLPFLQPYQNGHLLFVHATGLTDPSRSHFDAQKFMELGVLGAQSTGVDTGWVGRYLQTIPPPGSGLLRGMTLSDILPRSFSGGPASLPISDPDNFTLPGTASTLAARRLTLTQMYASEPAPLGPAALDTFDTMDLLATIDFAGYVPSNGALYPATTFGTQFKTMAALIKADVGVECLEADLGGWDLHNQLGPLTGTMASNLDQLSKAMLALYLDLGTDIDHVTVVVMSEFGRRAAQNASLGLDHGHGNCMLLMGGHVNGGQVIRNWPGLALANLDNGDLAITIDHRDVLAEILADRMACTSLATVFPNYTPTFRGVTS
jgi:uncharacterized protein (DUF1501 family)